MVMSGLAFVCLALHAMVGQGPEGWIDLTSGWKFKPDPDNAGMALRWHSSACADGDWAVLDAGKRWEEQGFANLDGRAWYRRRIDVPASWQGKTVWLVLGGANDACVVFCNERKINRFGDEREKSMYMTPLIADLTDALRFGESNLLAIEVFDWGANGGLWRLPCALTADPGHLPLNEIFKSFVDYQKQEILVEADLAGLGSERPDATFSATLSRQVDERSLAKRTVPVPAGEQHATLFFCLQDAAPGTVYHVTASVQAPEGKPFGGARTTMEVTWPDLPAWPSEYGDLKVLNNFVTELGSLKLKGLELKNCDFSNPRDGWLFISAICGADAAPPSVLVRSRSDFQSDHSPKCNLHWRRNPDTGAFESMRRLPKGPHQLEVQGKGAARLTIRTMPELAFCYYPSSPHIAPFGPYNWPYVEKHVLPHVNTLITGGGMAKEEFDQWLREGRQWVSNASLPGLSSEAPPTADEVYNIWANNAALADTGYAGIIVDEFLNASAGHYAAWSEAARRLHDHPAFSGKTFYAWCGDLYPIPPALEFSRMLTTLGDRFALEKYLREEPTEEAARQAINRDMVYAFEQWRKAIPGVEKHMTMCLGYLCAPPETLNLNPAVDYQVFLDMQLHALATHPIFWGLYGVMEYSASYADEESLRWAHKLFRHYCIEGRTTRLTDDPYVLPHLRNPDFAEGLADWEVTPAEEGTIGIGAMEGFSWLQGRYPRTTDGDRFCLMKRSARGPNRIGQTVRALKPGRLYSVKLISADIQQLDKPEAPAVTITVHGAVPLEVHSFQFAYPSCYAHEHGPYNRNHPAYFNLQRTVFRPKGRSVRLTISDWATSSKPGGPIAQQIGFNFVELQPFREP